MQPPVLQVFQIGFAGVREGVGGVRQTANVSLRNVERNQFVAWASHIVLRLRMVTSLKLVLTNLSLLGADQLRDC